MDYLARDSLHAGVPYGRNFDQGRLIGSLCLNAEGNGLAISEKGKTAAELMVFARYVMFSEVYWHHGVRAATAMLQRAFYQLHGQLDLDGLFRLTEGPMVAEMRRAAAGGPASELLDGLFGPDAKALQARRAVQLFRAARVYERLARRPYPWLVACAESFATLASTALGRVVPPHEILFDAPPVQREVEFNIQIHFLKENRYRPLGEVSPVVQTLAHRQFDDYVKRVRPLRSPAAGRSTAGPAGVAVADRRGDQSHTAGSTAVVPDRNWTFRQCSATFPVSNR